jgi:non-ribosomal peptide synthetase component F
MEADWQRRHAAYWNEHLLDAKRFSWPSGAAAAQGPSHLLGTRQLSFGDRLSAALRDLGRQARTLCAMVMLTVYAAAVSRWSGQRDFVVPFNVVGRHSEHESVVGYFSHPLYLRMQFTGHETFTELLSKVSNEFYRAVFHQDFGKMAMTRPELLSGMFFQWLSWNPNDISGLEMSAVSAQLGLVVENVHFQEAENLTTLPPALADMEMSLFETSHGIFASATYRADLFTADAVGQFFEILRHSTEQFVRSPSGRVLSGFD